jgi:hypothetical protein
MLEFHRSQSMENLNQNKGYKIKEQQKELLQQQRQQNLMLD